MTHPPRNWVPAGTTHETSSARQWVRSKWVRSKWVRLRSRRPSRCALFRRADDLAQRRGIASNQLYESAMCRVQDQHFWASAYRLWRPGGISFTIAPGRGLSPATTAPGWSCWTNTGRQRCRVPPLPHPEPTLQTEAHRRFASTIQPSGRVSGDEQPMSEAAEPAVRAGLQWASRQGDPQRGRSRSTEQSHDATRSREQSRRVDLPLDYRSEHRPNTGCSASCLIYWVVAAAVGSRGRGGWGSPRGRGRRRRRRWCLRRGEWR